jgi:hypothetical protein
VHDLCQLDSFRATAPATFFSAPCSGQPTRFLAAAEPRSDWRRRAWGTHPGSGRADHSQPDSHDQTHADVVTHILAHLAAEHAHPNIEPDATVDVDPHTATESADANPGAYGDPHSDADGGGLGSGLERSAALEWP